MADLSRIRIGTDLESTIPTAWADGLVVTLPSALVTAVRARSTEIGRLGSEGARELRRRAAFTPAPPISSRLPISYRSVPGSLRRLIATSMGRLQRHRKRSWAQFPDWPLDLSADFAADLGGIPNPLSHETAVPVLLTHDLDSPEGLRYLVERFLPIEERFGALSASYVVPCAWPLDYGLLDETARRGHELGVHGYDHGNRTPFVDTETRSARLDAARPLVERYGMAGYRAPSLLRTEALLSDLAGRFQYDSSIPTSGGLFPVPNNGCASARPFQIGGLWELPLTLPRDGSLRFLGHRPAEILRLWTASADLIARSGGMVSLLTHCEAGFSGNPDMLAVYREFLAWLMADGRFSFGRPRDLAARLDLRRTTSALPA